MLHPLAPLPGPSQCGYFNEALCTYVDVGCTIETVAAGRTYAALRDAGGAVSEELTAPRDERQALLKALKAAVVAVNWLTIEPALCTALFADSVCAHAPCRFLPVRRV